MKYIKILIVLTLPLTALAQNTELKFHDSKPSESQLFSLRQSPEVKGNIFADSTATKETTAVKRSTKSPGLAFIYGLFIPGMGHVYANNFKTGKYYMISEAAIWLTYAAFTIYGNWLLDDSYKFSTTHAGVTVEGKAKDDIFFTNIGNYGSVEEYNNEKLRFGEYDKVYLPGTGYDFYWDSDASRLQYRADKISGDRTLNDRLFVIGAVLINHVISAISAVFAANSYNNEIKEKGSGGFSLSAGVQKHFNKIDGIKLSLTKLF
jgi:hypothetical protein